MATHVESRHELPALHALPQPPQFMLSERVLTHAAPQYVRPAPQQCPWEHAWGSWHALSHAPQLALSVWRFA
jgi:hypothetical protein